MSTGVDIERGGLLSRPVDLSHWRFSPLVDLTQQDLDVLRRAVCNEEVFRSLPTLADGDASRVARARLSCGLIIIKRYRFASGLLLRTFLRRSLAEREARAMARVAEALPDNPVRVLAWAERRRFGLVSSAVIVTSELTDSCDLRELKRLEPEERGRQIEVVLEGLPARVAKLHEGGVFARSLRGKNVLLQVETGAFALIDCPRAIRPAGGLAPRQRAYDLATLSLELRRFMSAAQWQTFLEAYLRSSQLPPDELKQLTLQRIDKLAERIAHRSPIAAVVRFEKRRFRHTRIGAWILGRRPPQPEA